MSSCNSSNNLRTQSSRFERARELNPNQTRTRNSQGNSSQQQLEQIAQDRGGQVAERDQGTYHGDLPDVRVLLLVLLPEVVTAKKKHAPNPRSGRDSTTQKKHE